MYCSVISSILKQKGKQSKKETPQLSHPVAEWGYTEDLGDRIFGR
jgi:hypothetical protein